MQPSTNKCILNGAGFGYKLNLLRLAVIAVRIAKQITKPAEAVVFLNGVIQLIVDAKQQRSDQPLLYLKMQIAEYNLVMEQFDECKKEVEEGKEKLEGLHDVRSHYKTYVPLEEDTTL